MRSPAWSVLSDQPCPGWRFYCILNFYWRWLTLNLHQQNVANYCCKRFLLRFNTRYPDTYTHIPPTRLDERKLTGNFSFLFPLLTLSLHNEINPNYLRMIQFKRDTGSTRNSATIIWDYLMYLLHVLLGRSNCNQLSLTK